VTASRVVSVAPATAVRVAPTSTLAVGDSTQQTIGGVAVAPGGTAVTVWVGGTTVAVSVGGGIGGERVSVGVTVGVSDEVKVGVSVAVACAGAHATSSVAESPTAAKSRLVMTPVTGMVYVAVAELKRGIGVLATSDPFTRI
jgi:hypothetical protein